MNFLLSNLLEMIFKDHEYSDQPNFIRKFNREGSVIFYFLWLMKDGVIQIDIYVHFKKK